MSVAPVLCLGAAWLLGETDFARKLEWRTLDWRTALRARHQPPPDPRITIVLFGDATEEELVSWPPDRAVHGEMIKLLTLGRPTVVTWDVILDLEREGAGDQEMRRAAEIAGRAGVKVVTGAFTSVESDAPTEARAAGPTRPLTDVHGDIGRLLGDRSAVLPFPALREVSWYGFVDTPPGSDGVRREVPLVVRVGGQVFPSLALQTLMAYFDVPPEAVRVRLGDAVYLPTAARGELRLPVSREGRFLLNYRYDQNGDAADFTTISYVGIMEQLHAAYVEKSPQEAPPDLAGDIVFIGQTVTGKADVGPTPRSPASPLVLIHANLLQNVFANDFARRANPWWVWGGAIALGYAGLALGLRRSVWVLTVFGVTTLAGYSTAACWLWIECSVWLPLTAPVLGFAVLQFVVVGKRVRQEQRAREQVRQMFGTYLAPALLEKMIKHGRNVAAVSSERRPVSILFADLRDFTRLAETLPDDVLIAQLNEYLAAMVECIHEHGGTLHKFIGDAVMAVWGDLSTEGKETDALKSVKAAVAMHGTLKKLNAKWRAEGRCEFRMGVGLNHGVVLIGNIGSPRRMEFAAIGDAVNLAARLEGLTKELKTDMLIGESLAALLPREFGLEACGTLVVKGKAEPVRAFRLESGYSLA